MRVLLVDDNPDDRLLAARALRKAFRDVEVMEVSDEQGLAEALSGEPIDLVVTDYHLHFTDGLKVLHRVRSVSRDCVVIMFTGTGSEEIAVEAMRFGLDDYVLKHHRARLVPAVRAVFERRDARRATEEAERRFRRLFEEAPIGLVRIDADGRVADANTAVLRMLGAPDKAALNRPEASDLYLDPADRERWQRLADADLLRGFTCRVRKPDGSTLWAQLTGRAVRSDDGVPDGYELAIEDVTAERRVVAELQESEQRFQALADAASLLIWVSDAGNTDVFFNKGWLEFRGRTLDQESSNGWIEGIHPDEREQTMETYGRHAAAREPFTMEYRLQRATGEYRTLLDTGVPRFASDGTYEGYVGAAVDITDRLRAERERLRAETLLEAALEAAPIGVGFVDRDLRYVRVNDMLARATGLGIDEMVGLTVRQAIGPLGFADRVEPIYLHVLETGESVSGVELSRRTDRGERVITASFFPVVLDNEVSGVGVAIVDLTETRRLQEQLLQAQKLEAVGRFAAGIAHDFNNLLAAIVGYSALLESELGVDREHAERVAEIRRAAVQGADLVRRLLSFATRTPLHTHPVDLRRVLQDVITMLERILPDNVRVVLSLGVVPAVVEADEGRLGQVLINLALNAVDAMPDGGVLSISLEVDGSEAELRVSDTGVGIPPDVLPRIWDPFFTTKGAAAIDAPGGHGLGLSSVRSIVEQLGGRIEARSTVGEGTIVVVALPRAGQEEIEPGAVQAVELVPPPVGGAKVLVAEDSELLRDLFRTVLERAGYDVVTAENGERAFELAHGVDLVVADVDMPGLGGIELARRLAAADSGVPVLLVSGYAAEDLLEGAAAYSFLPKPFTPAELTSRVRDLLSR